MRKSPRLPGWRPVLCLLLFVGIGVAIVATCFNRRQDTFWDKYQKVQYGMTEQQVEDILGPGEEEWGTRGSLGDLICDWHEGQESIGVAFFPNRTGIYVVVHKDFSPRPGWEEFRENVWKTWRAMFPALNFSQATECLSARVAVIPRPYDTQ